MEELAIYRLNTGSCNGCDIEVFGALAERFKLSDAAARVVGEPGDANVLVVVGVVNSKMKGHLKQVYEKIKPPKLVVAVGSCALSSGVFGGSYNIPNLVDEVIPVNAYVPGCPPSPHAVAAAVAELARAKLPGWQAPEDYRGVPKVDEEKCTGCGACAQVCPARAIDMSDEDGKRTVKFDYSKCIFCASCEEICPDDAIEMAARYQVVTKNKAEAVDEAKVELLKCAGCGAFSISKRQIDSVIERINEDVPQYVKLQGEIGRAAGLCLICRDRLENVRAAKSLLYRLTELI